MSKLVASGLAPASTATTIVTRLPSRSLARRVVTRYFIILDSSFFFPDALCHISSRGERRRANRCQPVLIAKQLAKLRVVNIGAVGTFVVREDVSESALRAALVRNLPFKCEIMICPAKEILALSGRRGDTDSPWRASKDPFSEQPSGPNIIRFVSVLAKPLRGRNRSDLNRTSNIKP